MNGHFDPQGCQTLLLKESELFFLSLGSWTKSAQLLKNVSLFDDDDNYLYLVLICTEFQKESKTEKNSILWLC